eukprot:3353856-Amphidinium_carterae.1
MFTGEESRWRDWRAVFKAYCSAVSVRLGELMTSAEGQVNGVANGTLAGDDQALSSQLFYMLVTGVK